MDDLISRQALCEYALNQKDKSITPNDIMRFPSAQPETHDERMETHACDCISRQAAIDVCNKAIDLWQGQLGEGIVIAVRKKIEELPSAQPDSKETSPTHKALDTISRQAAIRWVKTECNPYGKPTLDFESGKKVIEHLKQMPSAQPETHEERTKTHSCDLIDRQAAIDAHYEYCNKHPDAGFPVWSLKILEDLPSAQPERKKGKWIPETEDWRNQIVWVKCSECGFDTSTSYNYCPNCGCRMDGGEQDE